MTTPITVKNEVGREKNPFINCNGRHRPAPCCSDCECDHWDRFEQSVKEHDAPNIPDTKEGKFVEAELVWQYKPYNDTEWNTEQSGKTRPFHSEIEHRQIYRLPQQPKGGPDLKQLEKRVDEFIENTSAEDYKKMFDEMDKEAKEQEKEKTAEEIDYMEGRQPFERYPKLAECLQYAACNWKVDMSTWSELLSEINQVCSQTASASTRISELERALTEIKGTVTQGGMLNGSRLAHIKSVATNALKVNNDGND